MVRTATECSPRTLAIGVPSEFGQQSILRVRCGLPVIRPQSAAASGIFRGFQFFGGPFHVQCEG